MTTTTTLSAMRHLLRETGRFDRLPGSGADSAFSALVPQGGGATQEWNAPTPVPTPVPMDLHVRLRADSPTPVPSTEFEDDRSRTASAAPTPVPVDPGDGTVRSSPTPVPTVPPEEDEAALTHRLAHSLLTGAEFQLTNPVRGSDEG